MAFPRGRYATIVFAMIAAFPILLVDSTHLWAEVTTSAGGAFVVKQTATVPCTPAEGFDAFTGDITPWWDHSFSKPPYRMFIEPVPGGRFVELFDSAGNGARHATVITVQRGKMLRFEGPLGLVGSAVVNVTTCTFEAAGNDSCRVAVEAHISGEIDERRASLVDGVWRHFLIERFAPYVASGAFRTKAPLEP